MDAAPTSVAMDGHVPSIQPLPDVYKAPLDQYANPSPHHLPPLVPSSSFLFAPERCPPWPSSSSRPLSSARGEAMPGRSFVVQYVFLEEQIEQESPKSADRADPLLCYRRRSSAIPAPSAAPNLPTSHRALLRKLPDLSPMLAPSISPPSCRRHWCCPAAMMKLVAVATVAAARVRARSRACEVPRSPTRTRVSLPVPCSAVFVEHPCTPPPPPLAGADSGQVRRSYGHHWMRRCELLRMSLAPLLPEPRSAIPANSGEGPPLFWSPESLRRRPPTWLAWGHPRATASGPRGSQLTGLTQSTADWAGPSH